MKKLRKMENTKKPIAIGREVISERFNFSFVQNFRRAARAAGVDFNERLDKDGETVRFFATSPKDVNKLKMLADVS